jgi:hypothetical protein
MSTSKQTSFSRETILGRDSHPEEGAMKKVRSADGAGEKSSALKSQARNQGSYHSVVDGRVVTQFLSCLKQDT